MEDVECQIIVFANIVLTSTPITPKSTQKQCCICNNTQYIVLYIILYIVDNSLCYGNGTYKIKYFWILGQSQYCLIILSNSTEFEM